MKKTALAFTFAAFVLALASSAYAQTTFLGNSLTNAANWSVGLPTDAGNPGTITVNGTVPTDKSTSWTFYMTQTAGTISHSGAGQDFNLVGGSFTQEGGTWGTSSGRGFNIASSNKTTIISGAVIGGGNAHSYFKSGASMTVNGGKFEHFGARSVNIADGAKLIVNGGTVKIGNGDFVNGTVGTTSGGILIFNGGTTTANRFNFARVSAVTFGGASAGSVTVGVSTNATLDWLTGTQMSLSLTNAPGVWAETEWDANRLRYNGQTKTILGKTWAEVTAPGGLGPKTYFNFTGTTLSLVTITYPPGTLIRFQ